MTEVRVSQNPSGTIAIEKIEHNIDRPRVWTPWSSVSPEPLTGKLTSDTANKIRELQAETRQRLEHVQAVHTRTREAKDALAACEAKVLAELDADAETCSDGSSLESAHAERVKALAELTETEELHEERLRRAQGLATSAQDQLNAFVTANWQELSAELEPQGNKVSERIRKITAEYEQKLSPLRQDWLEIRHATGEIVGRTTEIYENDLPAADDYAQPPAVSFDALARLNRVSEPAHQPATIGEVSVSRKPVSVA
jgi:hypothetical protein